jgi:hypothetical protein
LRASEKLTHRADGAGKRQWGRRPGAEDLGGKFRLTGLRAERKRFTEQAFHHLNLELLILCSDR